MAASTLVAAMAAAWVVPPPPSDPLGDLQRAERARSIEQGGAFSPPRAGCVPTGDEDILVCGRPERDYRVESVPVPGARRRLIAGEPPGGLAGGESRCSTVGPHVQCGGGLDLFGIAFTIVRAIARARANRD